MTREEFEDAVFNYRFLKGISKTGTGQFPFTVDCPFMDEFVRKDEAGNYEEPFVAGAWWMLQGILKHAVL